MTDQASKGRMQYLDFFLSYAWEDNSRPSSGLPSGWVDRFEDGLLRELRDLVWQRGGHFRDCHEIKTGEIKLAINAALARSIVFLPLLSTSYMQSAWCVGELDRMVSIIENDGIIPAPNARKRVIPLLLTPTAEQNIGPLRYQKYIRAYRSTGPNPNDWELLEPSERGEGSRMVREVAIAIKDIIEQVKGKGGSLHGQNGKVYVSASPDLQFARLGLQASFECYGYPVLPTDEPLPSNGPSYAQKVAEFLSDCRASFHGIGRDPSPLEIDGTDAVEYEFKLAKTACVGKALSRSVVWIPDDWETCRRRYREFVLELESNRDMPDNILIFKASFLELKEHLKAVFSDIPETPPDTGAPFVFFLYRPADQKNPLFLSIAEWMGGLGVTIQHPLFVGHPAHIRRHNMSAHSAAAAIVVFCGDHADEWAEGQYRAFRDSKCAPYGLVFLTTSGTSDFSPPASRARAIDCGNDQFLAVADSELRAALGTL